MTWPDTGLAWIPTSPNIPTLDSVAGYPMTGLGAQMGNFKHGIGTKYPFRFLTFEGKSSSDLKRALEGLKLSGLSYKIMNTYDSDGKSIEGVYVVISDWVAWKPTELAFAMMKLTADWQSPNPFHLAKKSEITLFNKHVGSLLWWDHLASKQRSIDPKPFLQKWEMQASAFRRDTANYLLY